jgi:hypothetical protein
MNTITRELLWIIRLKKVFTQPSGSLDVKRDHGHAYGHIVFPNNPCPIRFIRELIVEFEPVQHFVCHCTLSSTRICAGVQRPQLILQYRISNWRMSGYKHVGVLQRDRFNGQRHSAYDQK